MFYALLFRGLGIQTIRESACERPPGRGRCDFFNEIRIFKSFLNRNWCVDIWCTIRTRLCVFYIVLLFNSQHVSSVACGSIQQQSSYFRFHSLCVAPNAFLACPNWASGGDFWFFKMPIWYFLSHKLVDVSSLCEAILRPLEQNVLYFRGSRSFFERPYWGNASVM